MDVPYHIPAQAQARVRRPHVAIAMFLKFGILLRTAPRRVAFDVLTRRVMFTITLQALPYDTLVPGDAMTRRRSSLGP